MRYGLFNICALIAGGIVLAVSFIIMPDQVWTTSTTVAIAVFALAVAFIFLMPLFIGKAGDEAAQFSSIGPLGSISGYALFFSVAAVIAALLSYERLSLSLDVLTVGLWLIGIFVLRASVNIISNVSTKYPPSSHMKWQSDIQRLRAVSTEKNTTVFEKLAEKLRYLSSDIPGGTPFDNEIEDTISVLASKLVSSEGGVIEDYVKKVETLLDKREIFLRASRSKA